MRRSHEARPCARAYQGPHGLLLGLQLMQRRQHEDRSLAHARLGLAEHVHAQNGLRDALVLNLGRVLKTAIDDSA